MLKSPVGTLTFLMTDVEGSTRLWEEYPAAMTKAILRHEAIIHEVVTAHDGYHVIEQGEGDSTLSVFKDATQSAKAADEIRRRLAVERWADGLVIRVRMGLHSGVADMRQQTYYGRVVNRAARVRAVANGGQIVMTRATRELLDASAFPYLRDHGSLRLKDLLQPEHLFELPCDEVFPPLRSLDERPNNLPLQLTSFVGRQPLIDMLNERLRDSRLVTIVGSGGCGKTRLALQGAADQLHYYGDGAWFIDLATVSFSSEFVGALGAGLRTLLGVDAGNLDEIAERLKTRSCLLVLDNAEQIVDDVAKGAEQILRNCPNLKILVTSRERLGAAGESTIRIGALQIPSAQTSVDTLAEIESVQLFCDRAKSRNSDFDLTTQNAGYVAEICRRLDGIPLAIEQAASNVTFLSPQEIASRLADKFRLLRLHDKTTVTRQQTLRATIDWSYDLLTGDEQELFRRTSVFVGSISLAAVESVCSQPPLNPDLMLDLLQRLVDKSLITPITSERGETRYRLLEVVRDYALQKLGPPPHSLSGGFFAFYMCLASDADAALGGPEHQQWSARLDEERGNLRKALEWGVADGRTELAELVYSLRRYWMRKALLVEGRAWIERALGMPAPLDPRLQTRLLNALGAFCWKLGDIDSAQACYKDCVERWRDLGDRESESDVLNNLGILADDLGAYDQALVYYNEALATYRAIGDQEKVMLVLLNLGQTNLALDNFDGARMALGQALDIAKKLNDETRIAIVQSNLAACLTREGKQREALESLRECFTIWAEIEDPYALMEGLLLMALLLEPANMATEAAKLFGAYVGIRSETSAARGGTEDNTARAIATRLQGYQESQAFGQNAPRAAVIEVAISSCDKLLATQPH